MGKKARDGRRPDEFASKKSPPPKLEARDVFMVDEGEQIERALSFVRFCGPQCLLEPEDVPEVPPFKRPDGHYLMLATYLHSLADSMNAWGRYLDYLGLVKLDASLDPMGLRSLTEFNSGPRFEWVLFRPFGSKGICSPADCWSDPNLRNNLAGCEVPMAVGMFERWVPMMHDGGSGCPIFGALKTLSGGAVGIGRKYSAGFGYLSYPVGLRQPRTTVPEVRKLIEH